MLLDVERRIVGNNADDEQQQQQQQGSELSSLQIRCVKAIACSRGKIDFKELPFVRGFLANLPGSVLYEIIAHD